MRLLGAKGSQPVSASYIDAVLSSSVQGWASIGGRGRQRLVIERMGYPRAVIVADGDRPDLTALGVDSTAGFRYQFEPGLRDGEQTAVRYENGEHIFGSPVQYRERAFGDVNGLDEVNTGPNCIVRAARFGYRDRRTASSSCDASRRSCLLC